MSALRLHAQPCTGGRFEVECLRGTYGSWRASGRDQRRAAPGELQVPYEKGFNFLYYLQTIVGGKDQFLPFFKAFIAVSATEAQTIPA